MPKIRTYTVNYTITPNRHEMEVNIMYDINQKIFYVEIPKSFMDCVENMPDDLKLKYNINLARGIRGMYGYFISNESESVLIDGLPYLFNYCGEAVKIIKNVIIVFSSGNTSDNSENKYYRTEGNKESKELKQSFKFTLAIETKIGAGNPVYTYQNVSYTKTININSYGENAVVIDDTPENRAFLTDIYGKLDNLIINLKKFFATHETVIQLIKSNQKLLS